MPRQIVLRREPLLPKTSQRKRIAEVAGGTTAECAAVCCCFPCGIANLVFLAVYKIPAGICRKVVKKLKKKKKTKKAAKQNLKDGLLMQSHRTYESDAFSVDLWTLDKSDKNIDDATADRVLELEKEMWDQFYSTGFWRSSSQTQNELQALTTEKKKDLDLGAISFVREVPVRDA